MKNKHIAQSQWGTAHASTSVDFTQRTSQWQISPRLPWCAFVLSQNIRACMCFLGGGERKGKEWRDGWGQFGGPGCFNYPLLRRWVRAGYLFLALSLSHDLSSTFILKPSAPLAKQRKKGGQSWAFAALAVPHLPLISPNLLFFF